MDKTLQGLLRLAEEGNMEQRSASLLVLGAMKAQDDKVVKSAGSALDQENPLLRDYALRYFEEVRPKTGVPLLLPLLGAGDKEIRERAIRLLSDYGTTTVSPLLKYSRKGSNLCQLGAAQILCGVGGKTAWKGLFDILERGDLEVNKAVSNWGTAAIRELGEKEKTDLYGDIQKFADSLDEKTQRPALISAIRFIGQIGRPKSRRWLFAFVSTEHHHSIRFHVLVALLRCLHDEELVVDEIGRLLPILEEQEYSDLMRLTLELLESHSLMEKIRPQLSRLLESPHPSVQKFALLKMGEFHTPGVARTLIEQLGDRDYTRRDAAAHSLHKMPEARSALMKEFLACDDASKAWSIAELLPTFEGKWRHDILDGVWKRLTKAVEDTDRIQRSYFYFLKSVDPDFVYTQLASSGSRQKKAKKYREAIRYLSLLQELPAFKVEDKFMMAVSQLKIRSQAVQSTGRQQNPAIELLSDLFRSSTFPLLEALKKEKSLEPEDMFYLGFTFAEGVAEERTLGRGLLEFLARRHPRTKIGRNAKNKLKLLAA